MYHAAANSKFLVHFSRISQRTQEKKAFYRFKKNVTDYWFFVFQETKHNGFMQQLTSLLTACVTMW